MKKYLLLGAAVAAGASMLQAQTPQVAYEISQSDLRGTARFMSMGGAFGALGGDLSCLSQNPAGIGVYRKQEIGFTLDLSAQSTSALSQGVKIGQDWTKFYLNNIGGVLSWKLGSSSVPNLNFGFTYNKAASFNWRFQGVTPTLSTSMTNYIAGIAQNEGATTTDLEFNSSTGYDPYNPPANADFIPSWISVLGYDSAFITEETQNGQSQWVGQFGNGTSGSAWYNSEVTGGVDEYNISFGGNIANVVYWGMDFGITDINLTSRTYYGEDLDHAYIDTYDPCKASWNLYNYYNVNGQGFNYKLGIIVKPIQQLRLGFAFHTPTWYALTETFYADTEYDYDNPMGKGGQGANDGYDAYNDYNFRTPWTIIASAAGVIGDNLIVSADYEWRSFNGMHFSAPSYQYYGGYDYVSANWYQNPFQYQNEDIGAYYKATNSIRLGAEYRITPQFSARVGYSYVSSPVTSGVKNGTTTVYNYGTRPQHVWDNETQYVTCGLGYRYKAFYVDAAYVWKHKSSEYRAFPSDGGVETPSAKLTRNDSQVLLSMGFKF